MSIEQSDPTGVAERFQPGSRIELVEEMMRAIREDQVDALVVGLPGSERVHALRGADEAYRIFVEAMGEGAVNVSLDGTVLYCNSRFAQLMRLPLEEALGSSIFRFIEPADEALFRAFVWEGGTIAPARRDFQLRTADGTSLPALVSATPFRIDSVTSVCLLVTDLAEHNARLAAEAASQAKDRFFASLSHELRTPLTPVMMLISSIEDHPQLPDELREDLRVIRQNLELEARLIDDLLDLSRVVSGKLRIEPVLVDAHELVYQAIQMVEAEARAKRITIVPQLNLVEPCIVADKARVLQALWNVLKNAIKFSDDGGAVTVRSRSEDGHCAIDVIDNGMGISGELLPRLFNAFEQGNPTITRQYGGMGLGLAISKAVVELHQGTIRAHSDGPGRGATFTISLPLATARSQAPQQSG